MEWVRLDVDFFHHPRTGVLSERAQLGYLRALCYCGEHETDWVFPRPMLKWVGVSKQTAAELVAAGCWEPVEGGWHIHDAEDHQPDLEHLREVRQKRSDAGRKGAESRWHSHDNAMANAIANGRQTDSTSTLTTTPVVTPSPPKGYVQEVIHRAAERQAAGAKIRTSHSGFVAAAERTLAARHGPDLLAWERAGVSVEDAVDRIEPPPAPVRTDWAPGTGFLEDWSKR